VYLHSEVGGHLSPHAKPRIDSVAKRYVATLATNLFRLATGLVQATVVPRYLGREAYGSFQFLFNTARAWRGLLNLGSSSAFFTYNSKHRCTGTVFHLYSGWLVLQLILLLAVSIGSFSIDLGQALFPGQKLSLVLAIVLLEWLIFISQSLTQFGESKGQSVAVQRANFTGLAVQVTLIVIAAFMGRLDLWTFVTIRFVYSVLVIGSGVGFLGTGLGNYVGSFRRTEWKRATRFFVDFCTPLVIIQIASEGMRFFERWFLQLVGGSIEQAYFSLGFQWGNIALVFSTSVLSILWREVADAISKNDLTRAGQIFDRTYRGLILLTLITVTPVFIYTDTLISHSVGEEYLPGALVVRAMLLATVYQMATQLIQVAMYATERVRLLRNIVLVKLGLSVLLTYLLVAPESLPGPSLGLGSLGLSIQVVISNLFVANALLVSLARVLGLSGRSLITHQVIVFGLTGSIGLVTRSAALGLGLGGLPAAATGTGLFVLLLGVIILRFPTLLGLTEQEIQISARRAYTTLLKRVDGRRRSRKPPP
jgi:O-antigen/teichoic acid export membrane protein